MNFFENAETKLDSLAKPPKSLGGLEDIAIALCQSQKTETPSADKARISVFAGDHGVARQEKVSPYPPSVTALMVKTFLAGKAAINSIASSNQVDVEVINCGVEGLDDTVKSSGDVKIFYGASLNGPTKNLKIEDAMTSAEIDVALTAGRQAAKRAVEDGITVVGAGEMGIGNTTAATAIFCKLFNLDPHEITGPGTGLDRDGINLKAKVIAEALERTASLKEPLDILKAVGGFEIAAMTGFYLEAAESNLTILLDGFITTSAFAIALALNPSLKESVIVTTVSGEPSHRQVLSIMGLGAPVFDLGLRLGEGTGACLSVPVVKSACSVINNMATLTEVLEGRI